MTEAEKEILADLKARQTELKKFFKEVGAYHNEALSLLATRDLGKIAKKSRAHEKVPEYQALLDALHERRKDAEEFARKKYEYDFQETETLLDAEKEVIEQKFKVCSSRLFVICVLILASRHDASRQNWNIRLVLKEIILQPGKLSKP